MYTCVPNVDFLNLKFHLVKGPGGSQYDPSCKLILWCFLKEGNDIYQLLFTS